MKFNDLHGNECSLQESTAELYDAVWLGIGIPLINVKADGEWKDLTLPQDAVIHSRMHLSQKQVAALLPKLEHFVKTGNLPVDT